MMNDTEIRIKPIETEKNEELTEEEFKKKRLEEEPDNILLQNWEYVKEVINNL